MMTPLSPAVHIPVLLPQVLDALRACQGGKFVDCTVDGGGHAEAILACSTPHGSLLGLDVDPGALTRCTERLGRFGKRALLLRRNFAQLRPAADATGFTEVQGILFDLGLSSWQLAEASRGFSFQLEGPLDMRMDPDLPLTAATIVNTWSEQELGRLLWEYGEERHARRIARAIGARRKAQPFQTTTELAHLVASVYGPGRHRIHPATRTFQALRIAVNHELENLSVALEQAQDLLAPGGRLAVISFHSLEDRIVKHFFQQAEGRCICPPAQPVCTCNPRQTLRTLTKRPIGPDEREQRINPRSRSAKLRVAERI